MLRQIRSARVGLLGWFSASNLLVLGLLLIRGALGVGYRGLGLWLNVATRMVNAGRRRLGQAHVMTRIAIVRVSGTRALPLKMLKQMVAGALAKQGRMEEAVDALGQASVSVDVALADLYLNVGRLYEALDLYRRADREAEALAYDDLIRVARGYLKIFLVDQALRIPGPGSRDAEGRPSAQFSDHETQQSRLARVCERAALKKAEAEPLLILASAFRMSGDLDQSVAAYQAAARLSRLGASPMVAWAKSLRGKGEAGVAVGVLRSAWGARHHELMHPWAGVELGRMCMDLERPREAAQHFFEAMAMARGIVPRLE